jgi:hypothetical protein
MTDKDHVSQPTEWRPELTADERFQIRWIERNFKTRNKWSKQDYSDFYFRDVSLLLAVVKKLVQTGEEPQ